MSPGESEQQQDEEGETTRPPGASGGPRLRRRPLGYKKADVDRALEARDAELTELKQDIAALWLAFSQHDRMIRTLGGEDPLLTSTDRREPPPEIVDQSPEQERIEADAESIGEQLTELDEVLAAIEMATRTLEDTYADEIEASRTTRPENENAEDAGSEDTGEAAETDSERS